MKKHVIIWTLSLGFISLYQACEKDVLQGVIKGCTDEDGENIPKIQGTVDDGTVCVTDTEMEVQFWRCEDEQWHIEQRTPRSSHLRKRQKRGWFKHFFKGVACIATFGIVCGRSGPTPDKTRPNINCRPLIETGVAEPFQTYAQVYWKQPTAHDETDGNVRVIQTSGRASGRHFPEGKTYMRFYAKDRSGNTNWCTKTIDVTVKRCPQPNPVKNGYFICHPSTDFVRGGWCKFGCYDGFDLHGESIITCRDNEIWTASQPTCKAWTCPTLKFIDGADTPICTDESKFRSICTYNCKTGYDMPPEVSKTMVCSINKLWRQFGTPTCIDVESPMFEECPTTKVFGTDRGVNTSSVHWKAPLVTDNSGKHILAQLTEGFPSESRLTAGTYHMVYTARDGDGNSAKPCKFKVVVRDMRCPKLYPTPFVRMLCPNGYRTGAGCNISCDPGKARKGTEYVTCEKNTKGLYGQWNWQLGHTTTCISTHHCPTISTPSNGAVVCDNWSGGEFCQLQCRNGTQMSGVDWRKLHVCSKEGVWFPPPKIRPCTAMRHPRPAVGINAFYYFYGDCTDASTKTTIATNFIAALKSSLYKAEACPDSGECVTDNVMITCGKTERIRREAMDTKTPMKLTIRATLPLSIQLQNDTRYTERTNEIKNILKLTETLCNNNSSLIFGETPVKFGGVEDNGLDVLCDEGHVKLDNSLSCVECPVGTLFSKTNRGCVSCTKGTYQDHSGQQTCKRCPYGTTTRKEGKSSIHECEDACSPGTFSIDGVVPCSPCEHGEYQPSYGQHKCHICHGATTTVTTGSMRRSDCKEFDIELPENGNKSAIITLLETKTFRNFILSFWVKQETNLLNDTNDGVGIMLFHGDKIMWQLQNQRVVRFDKQESSLEITLPDTRWHNVRIESRTCDLSAFLDGIPMVKQLSTGQCNPITFDTVAITAGEQFSGGISQLNMWNKTGYVPSPSRCFYGGKDASLSWREFGDAVLTEAYVHLPSSCDDYDNCVSSPCFHGNCTDALHGYHCDCNIGFTGKQCELNIDDCQTNICMNNATCIDGVSNYTCACLDSFAGTYCEILLVHGHWSNWGNWTECSTFCGQGLRTRKRLCNNPHPDNGGRSCQGAITESEHCIDTECPVCPSIEAPSNGSADCRNETKTITCTISCNTGYDFDQQPLDTYICGPDTFYEWNFQTKENPERKLPKCTEIRMPEKLTVHYSAQYRDLYCSSDEISVTAKNCIYNRIKTTVDTLPCIRKETCSLQTLEITNCSNSNRERRGTRPVGVSLVIATQPDNDNANETLGDLEDAFTRLQKSAENGSFTVDVMDGEYELDIDSTTLTGEATCRPGTTRVNYYCVPCGAGSYSYQDYCKTCEAGSYQNTEGQLSCMPCPDGKTTLGIGSTNIQDCTVSVPSVPEEVKVTAIAAGSACAFVVVVILMFAYRRYRSSFKTKSVRVTDINLPMKNAHTDPLGPARKMYTITTSRKQTDLAGNADLPAIET